MKTAPSTPGPDRRTVLALAATWSGAAALAVPPCSADEALDQALERLHARPLEVDLHRNNHAPMVAEALALLGRPTAIRPWLDAHLEESGRVLAAREPVGSAWREALARPERFADWQALFLRELSGDDWRVVVRRWVARLAPGLAGAATHGVIRSAHAVRAVGAKDSELRRRELATGLAYWAASYQELPWDGSLAPEPSVEAALAKVELRQPALAPPRGNFVAGLAALDETPSFRAVAGRIDVSDPLATLHATTAAFGQRFLQNPERQIALTHAITAPSAVRLLLPYLDEETARAATRHAWQAAAGLLVVYGAPGRARVEPRATRSNEERIDAAVANGDAHALKLTEACQREDAVAPDPVFAAVAEAITGA